MEPRTSAGSGRSLAPDSRAKGPPSADAVPTGFVVPSFRAALPVRSLLANIPSEATVKSFYVRAVLRDLSENGHPMPDVVVRGDFNDYPTRAAADLLLLTAERLHGDLPQREALRRIGWTIFPALLDMTIGRVVYGALGRDIHAIAQAAPRGFSLTMSHAKCTMVANRKDAIELSLLDYHLFPDCFLVGVLEGALVYCGLEGAPVLVRPQSAYHVDYYARLEP